MKDKLVSVNITTYNRARLLERCISSILKQTYPALEIVVVDDFSTDNTPQLMAELSAQDARIKYIRHQTNQGNAKARNTALQHCTGHYVAFMDDDDEWVDNNKLTKQVAILEQDKEQRIGIVCSGVKIIKNDEEIIKREHKPGNLVLHLLKKNGIIHNSTVLTRRAIMLKVGGFDEKILRGVDSDFFRTLVVKYKYDVYFMPDITAAYHEHSAVRMTTNRKNITRVLVKSNFQVISKHLFAYLRHPQALIYRLYVMARKIVKT